MSLGQQRSRNSAGRRLQARCTVVLCVLLAAFPLVRGGSLSGTVAIAGGTTNSSANGVQQTLDTNVSFGYRQQLTPLVDLMLSYRGSQFQVDPAAGARGERRVASPFVQLSYHVRGLQIRLSASETRRRGTAPTDDLDSEALLADLNWKPARGPSLALNYREETNIADVSLFGRNTASRTWNLSTGWSRQTWSLRYRFEDLRLDARTRGTRLDQQRHEVIAGLRRSVWQDRLTVTADARIGRVSLTEASIAGGFISEVLPASSGLFAIDTSPEFGPLAPAADLVDGNLEDPTQPAIEIGGANTHRNIGLDLGFTRAIDRLEVLVDQPSDPLLIWEAWTSTDNLNWVPVPAVTVTWDGALLRYTLSFPEIRARYIKAVNISPNAIDFASVTECRALVDLPTGATQDSSRDTKRVGLQAVLQPSDRLSVSYGLNLEDRTSGGGSLISRDQRETSHRATLDWRFAPQWQLAATQQFEDLNRRQGPRENLSEGRSSVSLRWDPLPTFHGDLTLFRRVEHLGGRLSRDARNVTLSATADVWETLSATTDLEYSDIDDRFGGFGLSSLRVSQTVRGQPTRRWQIDGGWDLQSFSSSGSLDLSRRWAIRAGTTIRPLSSLSIAARIDRSDEDGKTYLGRRWNLSWSPGRRLSLSLAGFLSRSQATSETSSTSLGARYSLSDRITFSASFVRSTSRLLGSDPRRITSARAGIRVTI